MNVPPATYPVASLNEPTDQTISRPDALKLIVPPARTDDKLPITDLMLTEKNTLAHPDKNIPIIAARAIIFNKPLVLFINITPFNDCETDKMKLLYIIP